MLVRDLFVVANLVTFMSVILKFNTGWLKLKYPTRQNAISQQPCEIRLPKFQSTRQNNGT